MENRTIAILDSGVDLTHPVFCDKEIKGFRLRIDQNGDVIMDDDFHDDNGHGTAIYDIISQNSNAFITNVKIYDDESELSQENLECILEYLEAHFHFDLINMSFGIERYSCTEKIQNICNRLSSSGTTLISAFDNMGAATIPAALDGVIGVDGDEELENDEWVYIDKGIVNMVGKSKHMKVAWIQPRYILVQGNSFLAALLTAQISKFDKGIPVREVLGKSATRTINVPKPEIPKPGFEIHRAAVFPFGKEMHALARFENLLPFEMVGYYSAVVMGNVGRTLASCVKQCHSEKVIMNIKDIDWDRIDTLIIGHTDLCERITHIDYKQILISRAKELGKNIYLYDGYGISATDAEYENLYWPQVNENMLEKRFGKLYKNNTPILSIVGTNSKQGKFTLQLMLRERLLNMGYKVGQLGTEPTALLFGMDEMFACGYNSAISLSPEQTYMYVNQLIHGICEKDVDIVLTGSQTSILGYNDCNVFQIPLSQRVYLEAIKSDALVMCINIYDEKDYIIQSIKLAEGLTGGKVIALVCLPVIKGNRWNKDKVINQEDREQISRILEEYPLFWLDIEEDIDRLMELCISFFAD